MTVDANHEWDDVILSSGNLLGGVALGVIAYFERAPGWAALCFGVVVYFLGMVSGELGIARRDRNKRAHMGAGRREAPGTGDTP